MEKIWLGKSGYQWQGASWGTLTQSREGIDQASLHLVIPISNDASSNTSVSAFGAKDTR